MSRKSMIVAAALVFAPAAATAAPTQPVHAVVFVDVVPPDRAAGLRLLTGYVRLARQDGTVRSVSLLAEARAPNHFILGETFVDAGAYQRFIPRSDVRAFRNALFPYLGSPWDERLGSAALPSAPPPP